ncbi:Arylsulfatase [Rosistilla oblonga]|uniref:Arylsulfatase n=2 Tax=Rosistilla oblonga TaxID=2527990 RepID=A0A518ITG1_9BACT|nr:sulfatase [Rosistilla oblonga]QDV56375.1 Arylsulfatase [Rosistilla oblonga]
MKFSDTRVVGCKALRQVACITIVAWGLVLGASPLAWSQSSREQAATTKSDATGKPNLVLIIADDMNWNDCGAYGHPAIRTPNIDRLASEGLLFQHAYLTTNSCSPSRASILTGRYPHNTAAEQLHWPLPAGTATLAEQLRRRGYYTAAAGKWHLGDAVRGDFDKIYEASTAGFVLPSGKDGEPPKMIAAQPSGCEDWERSLDDRPRDRPFFLWLAALDPHREYTAGALDPPHRSEDVIVPKHLPDTPEVREDLRLYYDEIGRLDGYVGKVMAKLKQQGVDENTLVLFISDNGRPFPRDKTTLYDGGIRTPWIVRWPARIAAGETTDALVSAVDIAPTFLQLADRATPAAGDSTQQTSRKSQNEGSQTAGVDVWQPEGKSILATLLDPRKRHREFAFAEDHWHDYEDHARCVVDRRFKLIRNDYPDLPATPSADAGRGLTWQAMLKLQQRGELTAAQQSCFRSPRPRWELFDLQRDPSELVNRFDDPAYASVRDSMQQALLRWSQETGDYLPSRRTPDEFDRVSGEPDHSVRVRPRPSKQEMFGTNGKY